MRRINRFSPYRVRICPSYCIFYNSLDILIFVGRICFMAGLEIENLTESPVPTAARAEHLAAFEPTEQDSFIGLRNVEAFSVHFFHVKLYAIAYALSNRVIWRNIPKTFPVALSP